MRHETRPILPLLLHRRNDRRGARARDDPPSCNALRRARDGARGLFAAHPVTSTYRTYGRLARTVVPDFMYLEFKSLYLELKPPVTAASAAPPVAAVAGRPPYRNGRDARLQQREDPCLRLPEELGGTKNTFSRVGQPRITSPPHRPSRLSRLDDVPLRAWSVHSARLQFA